MERRHCPRIGTRIHVRVRAPDRSVRWYWTTNLSQYGVFLSGGENLREGTPVETVFVVQRGRIYRLYRRWGLVAHAEPDGMGLMLINRKSHAEISKHRVNR